MPTRVLLIFLFILISFSAVLGQPKVFRKIDNAYGGQFSFTCGHSGVMYAYLSNLDFVFTSNDFGGTWTCFFLGDTIPYYSSSGRCLTMDDNSLIYWYSKGIDRKTKHLVNGGVFLFKDGKPTKQLVVAREVHSFCSIKNKCLALISPYEYKDTVAIFSLDYGVTWDTIMRAKNGDYIYPFLDVNGNLLFTISNKDQSGGKVIKSTDDGKNWTTIYRDSVWRIIDIIYYQNKYIGLTANNKKSLVYGNDTLSEWKKISIPNRIFDGFGRMHEYRDSIFVISDQGFVYITYDLTTWTVIDSANISSLDSSGRLFGGSGKEVLPPKQSNLIASTDFGKSWNDILLPGEYIHDFLGNHNDSIIARTRNADLMSFDGGETWTRRRHDFHTACIDSSGGIIGYATNDHYAYLARSTNFGESFSIILEVPHSSYCGCITAPTVSPEGRLFVVTTSYDDSLILTRYSEDNGKTWKIQISENRLQLRLWGPLYSVSEDTLLLNDPYNIFRTTDRGKTWFKDESGQKSEIHTFKGTVDGKVFANYNSPNFYYSSNAGSTWESKTLSPDLDKDSLNLIDGISGLSNMVIDSVGNFFVSLNNRGIVYYNTETDSVTKIPITPSFTNISSLYITKSNKWLLGLRYGGILVENTSNIVDKEKHHPQPLTSFVVPNPGNSTFEIDIVPELDDITELSVLNHLGVKVMTLPLDKNNAMYSRVGKLSIDLSSYTSGVYYVVGIGGIHSYRSKLLLNK